jgi:septum formation protein
MTGPAPREFILASTSPRRSDLLREHNIPFRAVAPDVEENAPAHLPVDAMVEWNAHVKAERVATDHPEAVVLGVDTLVVRDGVPIGKPRDLGHAREMLRSLAGRTHEVFSGLCLLHRAGDVERRCHVISRVTLRTLTDDEIDRYFAFVNPLDKAGSYAAQTDPLGLITQIEGSRANVIGLPIERLLDELAAFGFVAATPGN